MPHEPPPPSESDVLRVFQSKDETRHFYNKIAAVYDLLAEKSEQPMREKGLALLAAGPGETILELGFGTGHCLVALARAVGTKGRILGVDIAEKMVERAEQLVHAEGVSDRVTLYQGDAEHLPFDTDSIDGIFTSFTLELFDTPELPVVLAEWLRVLKPHGRLVVVAISKEGGSSFLLKAFEWTHKHFPNLMDCRPIYVRRAMEAAGFSIQTAEIGHMWVPVEIVRGIKAGSGAGF